MSNPLAALEGYPKEGPEVPEREKVKREKDRHESGTGRRDREKRGGAGAANWGDPIKDQLAAEDDVEPQDLPEEPEEEGPKKEVVRPDFGEDDEEEPHAEAPKVVKVPPRFAGMVKTGEGVVVVEEEPDFSNCPKPKQHPQPKPKRPQYKPEEEAPAPAPPEPEDDVGEKKGRNQAHHAVQHNRVSNAQAHDARRGGH